MRTATTDKNKAREQLKEIERQKADLRDERVELVKARDKARAEFEQSGAKLGTVQFTRAKQAVDELQAVEQALEDADDAHRTVLGLFGQGDSIAREARSADRPLDEKTPGAWLSAVIRRQGGGGRWRSPHR